ncbi:hypothetical protein NDU88_006941 [Pleurodeles waltl]|uniref:Secreted protein n=1 Tax=Pleurodeles waltl TaxID=8319 RepID=A0AAV7MEB0_PLEWA|nr:hypothetical protein NDU88_006941 [Pleurodeles waltl]
MFALLLGVIPLMGASSAPYWGVLLCGSMCSDYLLHWRMAEQDAGREEVPMMIHARNELWRQLLHSTLRYRIWINEERPHDCAEIPACIW